MQLFASSHACCLFHWHFWAKTCSPLFNKLSVKSVHCSCPAAARRAFLSLFLVSRSHISRSGGSTGWYIWLSGTLWSTSSGWPFSLCGTYGRGLSINTWVRRPFCPHDQSWASSCSDVSPPASTSLWLWLPWLLCLFRENDFHPAAPSEQVACQIWSRFSWHCAVFFFFVESLPWCFLCNFI